jgi:hypothetical protein
MALPVPLAPAVRPEPLLHHLKVMVALHLVTVDLLRVTVGLLQVMEGLQVVWEKVVFRACEAAPCPNAPQSLDFNAH